MEKFALISRQAHRKATYMVPVIQEEMSQIYIVVRSRRTIDEDPTEDSVPRLYIKMRVIPPSSILVSMPPVSVGVSRGNRALSNAGDTIHLARPVLANTMEMQAGAVGL